MNEMSELNDTATLDEESLAERLERLKRGSLGGLRIFIRLAALRQQVRANTNQLDDLPNRRLRHVNGSC